MFYFVSTPWVIKRLYPKCTWEINTSEKVLYLTFDDGPHPLATPFVLEQLKQYKASATFFCIGKNVTENADLYKRIIDEGHRAGNHTFSHLNGWKTGDREYGDDVLKAKEIIESDLFRPPYGRITKFQSELLHGEKYSLKTIMWDVLSGDFDNAISGEDCYLNVINNAKGGSIVVFHDSEKAFERLKYALPRVLEYYAGKGYEFRAIGS
jgi:peptidoglycan-N-acetylglucosamine deacetylase